MTRETCVLCGATGSDVRMRLVHWRDAPPGMSYSHVPRCEDRQACRARVEDQGEPWPLVDTAREQGALP